MTKKITYKKMKTTIPEDTYLSQIDSLIGTTDHVTLKVTLQDFKVYEMDNTMVVVLDLSDDSGSVKGIMVGNRDDADFKALVNTINQDKTYKVYGKFCIVDTTSEELNLPFEIGTDSIFCIQAFQDLSSISI